MKTNVIKLFDAYKYSQAKQYPTGTKVINSYVEPRGGQSQSMFFGIQMFLREYLTTPINKKMIDSAQRRVEGMGLPFYREGWEYIIDKHDGFLPVSISCPPEGTWMDTRNVQLQIHNTDEKCAWLTSPLETPILRGVWYPATVATKSFRIKRTIKNALEMTSDIPWQDQIDFKLHDFGARGVSSHESAMIGGTAHLVNFKGTDTVEALDMAEEHYFEPNAGFSIPASEHSTVTSWGRENEADALENMLNLFLKPGQTVAFVSDSYDIWNMVKNIIGTDFRERIQKSRGTLVVRPDSGDPIKVPVKVIEMLMEAFGSVMNSKGYKVLPDCVRVIQGDGIDEDSVVQILDLMETRGLSADNIAFGMGGGLLQANGRDDLQYAMKASARKDKNGQWHDVYKDPIHGGKKSKRGVLELFKQQTPGAKNPTWITEQDFIDTPLYAKPMLREIYRNGKMLIEEDFETIRKRANEYL